MTPPILVSVHITVSIRNEILEANTKIEVFDFKVDPVPTVNYPWNEQSEFI